MCEDVAVEESCVKENESGAEVSEVVIVPESWLGNALCPKDDKTKVCFCACPAGEGWEAEDSESWNDAPGCSKTVPGAPSASLEDRSE